MFQNLKTRNPKESIFKNIPNAGSYPSRGFSHAPGATTFEVKGNELDRLVRCRHCGFICDRERDVRQKENSWAGFGINQGPQLTADASPLSDRRVPAAGNVAQTPDTYYDRDVNGGCPSCGSFTYDQ